MSSGPHGESEFLPRKNLRAIVADKLYRDIIGGTYQPGEKLPTQDELARRWNVSRITVREALNNLQSQGLVEVFQGRGTFVRDNKHEWKDHLQVHVILDPKTIIDLLEARKVVETALVRYAAERAEEEEFDALQELVDQMETAKEHQDSLEYAVYDFQFHRMISEIARNDVLYYVMDKLHDYIENQQRDMFQYSSNQNIKLIELSFEDHKQILAMMRRRDPEKAAGAMQAHIERINGVVESYYNGQNGGNESEEE